MRFVVYGFGGLLALLVGLGMLQNALPEGIWGDKSARATAATATARLPSPTTIPTATSVPVPSTATPEPDHVLAIGAEGHLVAKLDTILVARDTDANNKLNDVLAAEDQVGLYRLLASGAVFPVKNHARAKVLGYQLLGLAHVRLEDGAYAGDDGWVPYEWLVP